jgi:hypothetical protein
VSCSLPRSAPAPTLQGPELAALLSATTGIRFRCLPLSLAELDRVLDGLELPAYGRGTA